MKRSRRGHLALGAVLAGVALTLTGCSDSKTEAAPQSGVPASAPAPAPASAPTADGFCKAIEDGGGVALKNWNQPGLRQDVVERLNALVAAAPADLKPAMKDVADGYTLVSSGKVSEDI
jgi:hypothetical protein